MLTFTTQQEASDLHLSCGLPPMIRLEGDIRKINMPALTAQDLEQAVARVTSERQRKEFLQHWDLDLAYELKDVARFRVNIFRQSRGLGATFRVIPSRVMSMDDLGMGPVFSGLCDFPNGIVLVTGSTGCGKSTTLAAMIDYVNKNAYKHILTMEDPIEFVHESAKSLVNQREVHRHTHSFANALRAALREDPDVILVGELRDLETVRLALTAAETGHLVFATLHTSSASKTIDRVIDIFPGTEQPMIRSMLSESLRGVVSQCLPKKRGGGRCAAYEIMVGVPAVRNLVREGKVSQLYSTIQTSQADGMQTLDQCLDDLVRRGVVDLQEAAKFSPRKRDGS